MDMKLTIEGRAFEHAMEMAIFCETVANYLIGSEWRNIERKRSSKVRFDKWEREAWNKSAAQRNQIHTIESIKMNSVSAQMICTFMCFSALRQMNESKWDEAKWCPCTVLFVKAFFIQFSVLLFLFCFSRRQPHVKLCELHFSTPNPVASANWSVELIEWIN